MDLTEQARRTLLICAALSAVILALFWPVTGSEFINYDDPAYVTVNVHVMNGFTWKGVAWAFQAGFAGNWHPVTWLSHMLDVQLFGLKAGWHHFISLLLHVGNTLLLFLLLQRLTGAAWRSATVAVLFALHPLHVESVAWISERKDVLSAFFFMLTLWAYVRYAGKSAISSQWSLIGREGIMSVLRSTAAQNGGHGPCITPPSSMLHPPSSFYYALALLFFTLGLMSKPMLVTVPFVLLLLDYWPLRRLSFPLPHCSYTPPLRLLVEKLPFFILSALSCVMTFQAQSLGGAVRPLALLSIEQRLSNAVVSYGTYLKQTVWPAGLAIFYPLRKHFSLTAVVVAGVVLLAITLWALAPALAGARSAGSLTEPRKPWRVMGWFWFLGMSVPVIGLVQVGMQQTADRYTYLPLVGIFLMVVWEVSEWLSPNRAEQNHRGTQMDTDAEGKSLASGPLAPSRHSISGQSPWEERPSAASYPDSSVLSCGGRELWLNPRRKATAVLAAGLVLSACAVMTWKQVGYWHDSERLFRHALVVTRDNWVAHQNLGHALLAQGREDEAIIEYQAAVAIQPRPEIRYILGETLSKRRRYDEAIAQFSEMLKANPNNVPALVQTGIAQALLGRTKEGVEALAEALRINPADAGAHNSLGNILAQQGRHEEAVKQFEEALRLKPDHAGALNNLAISCRKLGLMDEAIAHYRQALRLEPDFLQALNNLAWTLATCPNTQFRNGEEAVRLATRACELTRYRNPTPLATLAAAYAETGRFQEAVSFAEQAQDLVKGARSELPDRLSEMLEVFRAGRPYYGE